MQNGSEAGTVTRGAASAISSRRGALALCVKRRAEPRLGAREHEGFLLRREAFALAAPAEVLEALLFGHALLSGCSQQDSKVGDAQPRNFATMQPTTAESMAPIKHVRTPTLDIAYEESGPDGTPVILLHGFPYDPRAYDGMLPLLTPAAA